MTGLPSRVRQPFLIQFRHHCVTPLMTYSLSEMTLIGGPNSSPYRALMTAIISMRLLVVWARHSVLSARVPSGFSIR